MMKKANPVFAYFRESKEELEKVSWPTRQDTIRYSVIVVVMTIALAAFLGVLDFGLNLGMNEAVNLAETPSTIPANILPEGIEIQTESTGTEVEVDASGNSIEVQDIQTE